MFTDIIPTNSNFSGKCFNCAKNAADKMKAIIENADKSDNVINFPA